ncbi:MAG: threonine synthase [Deltaproteobacteria bacterium]|nr:threonine synthase [Deltaproteobacteria bacterium]
MYYLADFSSKQRVEPGNFIFTGENGPWEVVMDLDYVRSRINNDYFKKSPPLNSKYLPFMPIKNCASFISLGEGATPLILSKHIGRELNLELYFKLESQNPTGSFKDRGSAVELSIARELNVKGIVVASTGNMAASCSCYAAAAQIPCFVFVPEDTPSSKLSQAISYGGRIVQVKGNYNHAARLAEEVAAELGFYLAGDYAFRVEGQKSAAFEIADQMYFQAPDAVMVPMGCGTNIAGYGKGFKEYFALGFIDRVPRMIGVQAEGAASIVNAFQKNSRTVEALDRVQTIASGIAVSKPLDGVKALDAIYSTNGEAVSVSDKEALEAQYILSKEEGLFVEASSATTLAALMKLCRKGTFANRRVVCVLTGHGLKDPAPLLNVAIKPPTIYPEVGDFLKLYENSFFEGKTLAFFDKEEVIFAENPTRTELVQYVQKYFNTKLADEYLKHIEDTIAKFLKKGKPITFSDFQDIVQDVLETSNRATERSVTVEDFSVQTGKDIKPTAKVTVNAGGVRYEASASGVGPVDAVINALKEALTQRIDFSLANYSVQIRSQGTSAVVYAELKLTHKGVVSLGKGTSPDIIQASIEAFESAYNGLASRAE